MKVDSRRGFSLSLTEALVPTLSEVTKTDDLSNVEASCGQREPFFFLLNVQHHHHTQDETNGGLPADECQAACRCRCL